MNFSLIIIGCATLITCLHKLEIYHRLLNRFGLDRKPFNCVLCSTFWFTLGFTAFTNPVESIFISTTAAVLAELIDIQIHKI